MTAVADQDGSTAPLVGPTDQQADQLMRPAGDQSEESAETTDLWTTMAELVLEFVTSAVPEVLQDGHGETGVGEPEGALPPALPPHLSTQASLVRSIFEATVDAALTRAGPVPRRISNGLWATTTEISDHIMFRRPLPNLRADLCRRVLAGELRDYLAWQQQLLQEVDLYGAPGKRELTEPQDIPAPEALTLTLGIEEEYQVVDPSDGNLQADTTELFGQLECSAVSFSREFYQSQLEVKTHHPTTSPTDQVDALRVGRRYLQSQLKKQGLAIASGGTHPFARWDEQIPTVSSRAELILHELAYEIRHLLTFATHIHVGVDDRELALQISVAASRFVPVLVALSANSPFMAGHLTGHKSSRILARSSLPRSGVPPRFQSLAEYDRYLELLCGSRALGVTGARDATKIWWDLRPHPTYPTVEFRVFDAASSLEATLCFASIAQALVARLGGMILRGEAPPDEPMWITELNRWRAAKDGPTASLIDPSLGRRVPIRYVFAELMDFIAPELKRLGTTESARFGWNLLDDQSGARRQEACVADGGTLRDVVDLLCGSFAL